MKHIVNTVTNEEVDIGSLCPFSRSAVFGRAKLCSINNSTCYYNRHGTITQECPLRKGGVTVSLEKNNDRS